MYYPYRCPDCGKVQTLRRSVSERDDPVFCTHTEDLTGYEPGFGMSVTITRCERLLCIPQVNADLEKDRPENNLGRILSRSSSTKDQLEALKADERRTNKTRPPEPEKPKYTSVDDILATGLHPSMTRDQVQNWRRQHIPKDEFAEASIHAD